MGNVSKNPMLIVAGGFVLFMVLMVTVFMPGKIPFLNKKAAVTPTPAETATGEKPTASPKQPETKITSKISPTVPVSFDLKFVLNELLELTDKEIRDSMVANYNGCQLRGSYTGRLIGGQKYVLNESSYQNASNSAECEKQSLYPTYMEAYWTNPDIFIRQFKDKTFEKVGSDSSVLKASDPALYLKQILIDPELHRMVSSTKGRDTFDVETSASNQQYNNSYIFSIGADNKIKSIDYEASGSAGFLITGHITIASPSAIIAMPALPDRSNFSSGLEDIYSYAQPFYSVQTERYFIGTDKSTRNIKLQVGEGAASQTKECDITQSACQGRLLQLRTLFTIAKLLIFNAEPDYCTDRPVAGSVSQTYKNRLVMEINNEGRDPSNTADYSVFIDFTVDGDKKYNYWVKLKKGNESCFAGKANQQGFDIMLSNLVQFVTGF